MDITSSQKRSTPNSTPTSKEADTTTSQTDHRPPYADMDEPYDRSYDLVERVRRAREAAHKKMNAFSGNLDDYVLVRKIVGQKSVREQQRKQEEERMAAENQAQGQLTFQLDPTAHEETK